VIVDGIGINAFTLILMYLVLAPNWNFKDGLLSVVVCFFGLLSMAHELIVDSNILVDCEIGLLTTKKEV
jgi:hypothetical protein